MFFSKNIEKPRLGEGFGKSPAGKVRAGQPAHDDKGTKPAKGKNEAKHSKWNFFTVPSRYTFL
jgi:hypothetical protein